MRRALALMLAVAIGCAGPRRSDDPVVRDQEIIRDIAVRYLGDDRFARVQVSCEKGVVTLDGIVTDETDKDLAYRLAWGVSGVREVRSRVRLRSR